MLVGGSARRQKRVTTNRFVKMNGDRTYVTRRDRSAPIVPIQCDYHGVLKNQNKHKLSKYKDKSRKSYPYQCRLPPFDDIDFFLDDSFNGSLAILQLHKIPVLRQIW